MRIVSRLALLAALITVSAQSIAGPTGLIVIPTADIREKGTYELEWQHDGQEGFPANADITSVNTQFGITDRLEAGVDFGLSAEPETDLFVNAKYGFPVKGVPIAVGVYNVGKHLKPISYLMTGTRLGEFALHLGAQRTSEDYQLLLGAHREFGRLTLIADYTSGDENFASAGFEYAVSDKIALLWGILFPNDDEADRQHTLHVIYNNAF